MTHRPEFEFLLPLYGDAGLCRLAIESVLGQTRTDFILTIADDSGPEFPLAEYVRTRDDSRVEDHQNPSALGAGGNFRRVLFLASGARITFMGADDILHPNYLERMAALVEQTPDADVIQPGVRVIDAGGAPVRGATDRVKELIAPSPRSSSALLSGEPLAISLLTGNWTYFPSLMWRRECVSTIGFRHYDVVQDLGLLLDVVMRGGSVLIDEQVTFDYRRHGGSPVGHAGPHGRPLRGRADVSRRSRRRTSRSRVERAARRARLRVLSRLHAAMLAPGALIHADSSAGRNLLRHAFGR